jgi:hypothetical protein
VILTVAILTNAGHIFERNVHSKVIRIYKVVAIRRHLRGRRQGSAKFMPRGPKVYSWDGNKELLTAKDIRKANGE